MPARRATSRWVRRPLRAVTAWPQTRGSTLAKGSAGFGFLRRGIALRLQPAPAHHGEQVFENDGAAEQDLLQLGSELGLGR